MPIQMTCRFAFVMVGALGLLTSGCGVGTIRDNRQDAGHSPDAGGGFDGQIAPDAAEGGVDASVPTDLAPCANGICWDTSLFAAPCS